MQEPGLEIGDEIETPPTLRFPVRRLEMPALDEFRRVMLQTCVGAGGKLVQECS
jgi:hypothetical protein